MERRAGDVNSDEIGELIKMENDPRSRAILIVLQNINLSLIANTKTVNDIDEQLKEHMDEYKRRTTAHDAVVNQGRGAWKIVSWVLGVAQLVITGAVISAAAEIKSIHAVEVDHEQRLLVLELKK